MPYVTLTTNAKLNPAMHASLATAFISAIVTHAGKPESSVMIAMNGGVPMRFQNDGVTHAAFIEIKYIGSFDAKAKQSIVADICAALGEHARVPGERVYIKFTGTPPDQWGCNGEMFG